MAKLIRRGASRQPLGRLRLNAGCPSIAGAFVYPLAAGNVVLGAGRTGLPSLAGTKKIGEVGQYVSLSGSSSDFIRLGVDSRMQAEAFTALMVIKFDAFPSSGSSFTIFESGSRADQTFQASNDSFQFRVGESGDLQVIKDNVLAVYAGTAGMLIAGKWAVVSISFKSGDPGALSIAINGRIVGQHTPSVSGFKAGDFTLGVKDGTANEKGPMDVALFAYWPRTQIDKEQVALTANPWQLFEGPSLPVFAAPAAVPATLSGSAAAVASAYGTLKSAIPLTGAALAAAAGSAALSASITLAGAAGARADGAGTLSASIALAGAAVARATATGALSGAGTTLAGAAAASASATGALWSAINLAGTALAEASASGALAGSVTGLSGTARAEASATGALSTSIRLAGATVAQAGAAGALSSRVQLAGAAAAVASAYGGATSRIALGGAVVANTTARGALSTAPLKFDISKIHPSRIAVFGGSGSRVAVFGGSGSRVSRFT